MKSRIRAHVFVPLVAGFVMMWGARSHDDGVAAQKRTPISVTRIFTGADGQTHAEEIDVKLLPGGSSSELSEMIKVTGAGSSGARHRITSSTGIRRRSVSTSLRSAAAGRSSSWAGRRLRSDQGTSSSPKM